MSDPVFGATTFDFNANGLLAYEQGPWTSNRVSYAYNNALLRSQLTLQQPTGSWVQNYGYDSSRRLTSITAPSISATPFAYTYLGASRRVSQITLPNGGKVVNTYDTLARLTATRLRRQDNTDLNKHEYQYNNRHERTKHTRMDNSYVDFGFDGLGQLTNAPGYLSNGTPIANERLRYTYDGGWNMTARTENGVAATYTINDRNQATAISGVGTATFDINGNITALLDNHPTAAATSATYRYDPYGRLLASDGGMAAANLYRFSSKEVQANSGLYYYGFRYFDPVTQRWLNRDPLEEDSGINLYGFVLNRPIGLVDPFGLEPNKCEDSLPPEQNPKPKPPRSRTWYPPKDALEDLEEFEKA